MVRILLLLSMLAFVQESSAQEYFQRVISPGGSQPLTITKVIETQKGNLMLLGRHPDSSLFYIAKLTGQGDPVWMQKYTTPVSINDMTKLPENTFAFTGSIVSQDPRRETDILVFRLDANGKIIWSKTFGSNDEWGVWDSAHSHAQGISVRYFSNPRGKYNDSIIIVSAKADSISYAQAPVNLILNLNGTFRSGFHDVHLLRFPGEPHNQKIQFNSMEFDSSGILTGTHSVLQAGSIRRGAGKIAPYISRGYGFYDSWEIRRGTAGRDLHSATGIFKAGNVFYITTRNGYIITYHLLKDSFKCYSLKPKSLNYYSFHNISINRKKQLIITGYYHADFPIESGLILKTDTNLNILSSVIYQQRSGFNSIAINKRGKIFAGGYKYSGYNRNNEGFLVKTPPADTTSDCKYELPQQVRFVRDSIYVNAYLSHGDEYIPDTFNVELNPRIISFIDTYSCTKNSPEAGFQISDSIVCTDNCITLTDTTLFASNKKWITGNNPPDTFTDVNPGKICFREPDTFPIKLIAQNQFGSDTAVKTIIVQPLPEASIRPSDTSLCRADTISLKASGGVRYTWDPAPEGQAGESQISVAPVETQQYMVTVEDTNQCTDTDSAKLTVLQPPFTVQSIDTTICNREQYQFILNAGNPGYKHKWSTGATGRKIRVSEADTITLVNYNRCFSDTTEFTFNKKDCRLTYFIPNAFTPDNNGINDRFFVKGRSIQHIKMMIFNRWGQVVYRNKGPNPSWNGNFNNSKCPAGTYLYLVRIKGKFHEVKTAYGKVRLIRAE